MKLVGAGCPRTGTASLKAAIERLLAVSCCHMSAIDGHPFDLGVHWRAALEGKPLPDEATDGFGAAVDWPASLFWRELSAKSPEAVVLLSRRESAEVWYSSVEATILPALRQAAAAGWPDGEDASLLFERFTGSKDWDDEELIMKSYSAHNDEVRRLCDPAKLVEWQPGDGWQPICDALGLPVPDEQFPWTNRREEWGVPDAASE